MNVTTTIAIPLNDCCSDTFESKLDPFLKADGACEKRGMYRRKRSPLDTLDVDNPDWRHNRKKNLGEGAAGPELRAGRKPSRPLPKKKV